MDSQVLDFVMVMLENLQLEIEIDFYLISCPVVTDIFVVIDSVEALESCMDESNKALVSVDRTVPSNLD